MYYKLFFLITICNTSQNYINIDILLNKAVIINISIIIIIIIYRYLTQALKSYIQYVKKTINLQILLIKRRGLDFG